MSSLYEHETIDWNRDRARRAVVDLMEQPEWGATWLIDSSGMPLGYTVLTTGYSLEFGGRFALLDEFYIEEKSRGRGAGSQVLAILEEECRSRGWKALRLEVGHGNRRALRLYERSGFVLHDRHFMTKVL